MTAGDLPELAQSLFADDKGLLAMDESIKTCNARVADYGIPETAENSDGRLVQHDCNPGSPLGTLRVRAPPRPFSRAPRPLHALHAGSLWAQGQLVGKAGSVFTSSATQHGGQESTILSFHTTLLHHGMVIVGLPYAFAGQMRLDDVTGGSPYGASIIAGGKGERLASENELAGARFQGKHVAEIAKKLAAR